MNPHENQRQSQGHDRPNKGVSHDLHCNVDPLFGNRLLGNFDAGPHPTHLNLFTELQPAERDIFLARCTRQQFASGTDIFSQGGPSTSSYLIRSGVVRTYYVAPSGKEITIAHWPEGTLIGGPNVFKEQRSHIWSAQAITEVVAEQIRGQDLEELTMRIPRLAYYLIESLSFKLHWVSVLLQSFGTQSVRVRIAHLLWQLVERYGVENPAGILIAHHVSHEELGRMVGATRCWVTLALKELRNEGIIATHGRDIVILSMKKLIAKTKDGESDSSTAQARGGRSANDANDL